MQISRVDFLFLFQRLPMRPLYVLAYCWRFECVRDAFSSRDRDVNAILCGIEAEIFVYVSDDCKQIPVICLHLFGF